MKRARPPSPVLAPGVLALLAERRRSAAATLAALHARAVESQRALRARVGELRASHDARRAASRAASRAARRVLRRPAPAPQAKRIEAARERERQKTNRRRALLLVALLALLALLGRCRCDAPAPTVAPELAAPAASRPTTPRATPAPLRGRTKPTARGALALQERVAPAWLQSFRSQVAARGPALAACFEGADKPGALRWRTTVEPETGAVSDHAFEPLLGTNGISRSQERCMATVLERGRYRLQSDGSALPRRVGLIVEF